MTYDYSILSPELTVKALRDSGYRNTAFAVAELIDNSIDANATEIDVIVDEQPGTSPAGRTVNRIDTIAVLDNGDGMDESTLRRALKFGDGHGRRPGKIGRFGMGLPNSSLSQCQRADVWSWTDGVAAPLHTYLDLNRILKDGDGLVPEPDSKPIPEQWQQFIEEGSQSGTLVVWSKLDRTQWFRADSTFNNTERIIGRVYRRKIASGEIQIQLVTTREGVPSENGERLLRVNDPLYLTRPSTTPLPFADTPMFDVFPLDSDRDDCSATCEVADADGVTHQVIVRASIAKREARLPDIPGHPWPDGASPAVNPGNHPWGRDAGTNVGVSVLREGRELAFDHGWANPSEVTERWWGIEIEFPEALDEVFGVTNTKQAANVFHELAAWSAKDEKRDDETDIEMRERLKAEGDPRGGLIDLAKYLHEIRTKLRRNVDQQTRGTRSKAGKRHDEGLSQEATDLINRRRKEGHEGETDRKEKETTEAQRKEEQIESLTGRHKVPLDDATTVVEEGLQRRYRARYVSSPSDTPAFFSPEMLSAMLQVSVNTEHPVYARLEQLLEPPSKAECDDPEQLRKLLEDASDTVKLLLFAWARVEDEATSDQAKRAYQRMRQDWGTVAQNMCEPED